MLSERKADAQQAIDFLKPKTYEKLLAYNNELICVICCLNFSHWVEKKIEETTP